MHRKYVLRFSDNKGPVIAWSETIKKEARGLEAIDLGEVQTVGDDYIKTERGILKRESFYLPRDLVEAFDGSTLWFRIAPGEVRTRFREEPLASWEEAW